MADAEQKEELPMDQDSVMGPSKTQSVLPGCGLVQQVLLDSENVQSGTESVIVPLTEKEKKAAEVKEKKERLKREKAEKEKAKKEKLKVTISQKRKMGDKKEKEKDGRFKKQ